MDTANSFKIEVGNSINAARWVSRGIAIIRADAVVALVPWKYSESQPAGTLIHLQGNISFAVREPVDEVFLMMPHNRENSSGVMGAQATWATKLMQMDCAEEWNK